MNYEIKGNWWYPEIPDKKVHGTLENHNDFFLLRLVENLSSKNKSEEVSILHGKDNFGRKITLYDLKNFSSTTKNILVTYVIFDSYYHTKEDIKFQIFAFHFQKFPEWLNISPVTINESNLDEFNLSVKGYTYDYQLTDFKFSIFYRPTHSSSVNKEWSITHNPLLKLEFNESKHLDEIMDLIWYLQDFFILLSNRKIHPYGYRAMDVKNAQSISLMFIEGTVPKIEHLFGEEIPFRKIKDNLQDYLTRWLHIRPNIRNMRDLFFGLMNLDFYPEFKLLTYTQIIESYHRIFFGGEYIPETDYKPIKDLLTKAIPQGLDSSHKESLKSRIKYGNEYSLRKRLKDIILNEKWTNLLSYIIRDVNEFENQVINTRNYLTHYSKSGYKKYILEGEKLRKLNLRLKYLCHFLFLNEIGLTGQILEDFLKYSGELIF